MYPININKLVEIIFTEYSKHKTIFGISKNKFFYPQLIKQKYSFLDEPCSTLIGPAAGPHTQLAQNIIASYLTGGRFFELKTVQKLDSLEFDKPCIEAYKEGYNTEWSTELSITDAYDEYMKAWIILHILNKYFKFSDERDFIFNMSVGYDLNGIKENKVDTFIDNIKNASTSSNFESFKSDVLVELTSLQIFSKEKTEKLLKEIPTTISNSVTLSTMHGCPPEDIEAICKYLIQQKQLNTFVKLNPTLLGYKTVKTLLDNNGFDKIQLKEESFTHDLQYPDAVKMLTRLVVFAKEQKKHFGIKLSNTLPSVNTRGYLPGEEMYMSGRSLFPLTINLANKLVNEFKGQIPISFSGGADFFNIQGILECGLYPVTFATTLLKPGGYARIKQIAEKIDSMMIPYTPNGNKLQILSNKISKIQKYKPSIPLNKMKIKENLPLFDCTTAPCVRNCPIEQDIPGYIRLVSEKKYNEAFQLIISNNPLPSITGSICDHQCMVNCTRQHYDEAVLIRELKLVATKNRKQNKIFNKRNELKTSIKVAIIGAGPSGLSAGYFLSLAGFDVTIFDKNDKPGGVIKNIIPDFRIADSLIEQDIDLIKSTGVKFKMNCSSDFSISTLKKEYKFIYLSIGAEIPYGLDFEIPKDNYLHASQFLKQYKKDNNFNIGQNVLVIGGGNTAMDCARAAKKIPNVKNVKIVYRRTKEYMPADFEEYVEIIKENIEFVELLSPVSFTNGKCKFQKMKLGEPDKSGRRSPKIIDGEFIDFPADMIISAIGESVDKEILNQNLIRLSKINIDTNETNIENVYLGGDALRGPSTIVRAIADGRKIANDIMKKENIKYSFNIESTKQTAINISSKKGVLQNAFDLKTSENQIYESNRCLECDLACNRCVEVCPNRSNVQINLISKYMSQPTQIIHIDSYCNECGNCETFCPFTGAPYKEKITLFSDEKSMQDSTNNGFLLKKETDSWIIKSGQQIHKILDSNLYRSNDSDSKELKRIIEIIQKIKKDYNYLIE